MLILINTYKCIILKRRRVYGANRFSGRIRKHHGDRRGCNSIWWYLLLLLIVLDGEYRKGEIRFMENISFENVELEEIEEVVTPFDGTVMCC